MRRRPSQRRVLPPGRPADRSAIRSESGFTLIEVLVVLVIIAVLLAIAVPAYLGYKDRAKQNAAGAVVRMAEPSANAFFVDNGTFTGMNKALLKLNYDRGLSNDIVSAKPETGGTTYCISAHVGSWWAHVNGPNGQTIKDPNSVTADPCP